MEKNFYEAVKTSNYVKGVLAQILTMTALAILMNEPGPRQFT